MRGQAYIALAATLMMACASSKKPDSKSGLDEDPLFDSEGSEASRSNATESKGPQCLDAEGYPISCLGDKDCCPGYYCGYDPEGSQREKTCLYGG